MRDEIVVYTAVTGQRDEVQPALFQSEGVRYIYFSDRPVEVEGWEYVRLDREFSDPSRDSRRPKIRPDLFLPDSQISLWHDGHFQLKEEPRGFCEKWLQGVNLALFSHFRRHCLYEEAVTCKTLRRDTAEKLDGQVKRYKADKMPSQWGLYCGTVLLRRHLKPEIVKFSNLWWDEYMKGSRRDQISLAYVMWKTGIKFSVIPGNPFKSPIFVRVGHKRKIRAS